jgi:DNA-binding HxlR family transcriptional regulator
MKPSVEHEIQTLIAHVQDTLYVLGGKWRLPIIIAIKHGNKRFKDIKAFIPKITNRVLSAELKQLEANKLIKRTVYDDYPITVEYTITDYADTVKALVKAMGAWGEGHRKVVRGK